MCLNCACTFSLALDLLVPVQVSLRFVCTSHNTCPAYNELCDSMDIAGCKGHFTLSPHESEVFFNDFDSDKFAVSNQTREQDSLYTW